MEPLGSVQACNGIAVPLPFFTFTPLPVLCLRGMNRDGFTISLFPSINWWQYLNPLADSAAVCRSCWPWRLRCMPLGCLLVIERLLIRFVEIGQMVQTSTCTSTQTHHHHHHHRDITSVYSSPISSPWWAIRMLTASLMQVFNVVCGKVDRVKLSVATNRVNFGSETAVSEKPIMKLQGMWDMTPRSLFSRYGLCERLHCFYLLGKTVDVSKRRKIRTHWTQHHIP